MLFNFGKCKCLNAGPGNTGVNYDMGGTILSKTVKEKNLGVTMNANMKVSEQCRIAASKGNQVIGMIRRNITEVFKILNGYENIDSNIFFEIKESKITRRHNFMLVKKQSRLDVRKFSFSQRSINIWNTLSTECVHASNVKAKMWEISSDTHQLHYIPKHHFIM